MLLNYPVVTRLSQSYRSTSRTVSPTPLIDYLVFLTAFLISLWIAESWLPQLSLSSDVIALRFLLFLSHTYGVVLLLTTPLIAVETVLRLQWPQDDISRTVNEDGPKDTLRQCSMVVETEEEEEEGTGMDKDQAKGRSRSHAIGYLCCLSVWVLSGLHGGFGWRVEELWSAACIGNTNSLMACLPTLLTGLMPDLMEPCWGLAALSLLLLLTVGTGLHRRHLALIRTDHSTRTHREKHGTDNSGRQPPVLTLTAPSKAVNHGTSLLQPTRSAIDPPTTQSSCAVLREWSWSSMQMSLHHHGDFVLLSLERSSAGWGGQEHKRTKRGIPLVYITEEHTDPPYRSRQCGWRRWGFPCLGVNVITGLVGVLSVCALPLNLSVNILLIQTIEIMLELGVESLVSLQQRQERSLTFNT